MRAIAVNEAAAKAIASGKKKVEHRTRRIALGPLLLASGGRAVCIVDVWRVTERGGAVQWHLRDPQRVRPVAVGRSYGWIWHVDDDAIRRNRPAKVGPYSLHVDGRTIERGIRFPEQARARARAIAREHNAYVRIERDGYEISGEGQAPVAVPRPARGHRYTFAIAGERIPGSEATEAEARATAAFLSSFHHGARITILRDGQPIG